MQTFLPYPDFEKSVATLDVYDVGGRRNTRLGKQRVETLQLIIANLGFRVEEVIDPGDFLRAVFAPTMGTVEVILDRIGDACYPAAVPLPEKLDPSRRRGWDGHRVARMWRGYEAALLRYQRATCRRWVQEFGYNDTCLWKSELICEAAGVDTTAPDSEVPLPPWFGDERVHLSHRAVLAWKQPEHYGPLFPDVPEVEGLEYWWPPESDTPGTIRTPEDGIWPPPRWVEPEVPEVRG